MVKAIGLLSGGLDSTLATRLILDQGIEVEALNFVTVFCNCTTRSSTCLASKAAADRLGVKLKVFEVSREYMDIVKAPMHGYGRNLNPCLDCRIFIFSKARQYMEETGSSFVFTGEVLGERPMSQRLDAMRLIEKKSGLSGMIVRPLCAKLLEPSIPEKNRLVDRDRFLDIHGRSRKPQIALAKEFNINDYPCPAGGCLLTDKGFSDRMRDLMKNKPDFGVEDARLLKLGRHFRLAEGAKLIVGRDKYDNERLLSMAGEDDIRFYPNETKGPVGIGKGRFTDNTLSTAASVIARYCDGDSGNMPLRIKYEIASCNKYGLLEALPMDEELLQALRI